MFKIMTFSEEDRNQLLARMRSDIEYYLGYGNRDVGKLWAKNCKDHIEYMFTILGSLNKNYSGVTLEDINRYAGLMNVGTWVRTEYIGRWENKGIVFAILRRWGDEKGDRLECYTFKVGEEGKAKRFAKAKGFINIMDFLLYCQYNYRY